MPRWAAVLVVFVVALGVGVFIEDGNAVGAWMDFVSIYAIPLGALCAAIMFFWVCPEGFRKGSSAARSQKAFGSMV